MRKTKNLRAALFLLALLGAAFPALAQSDAPEPSPPARSPWTAGFVLGVNGGKITNLSNVTPTMRPGLQFGGFVNIAFSRVFSLESQLYFTQKGAQYTQDILTGTITGSINVSYFEVPLLFRIAIPLGQDIITRPRLFGGAYGAVMTRAVLKQTYEDFYGSDSWITPFSNMKRFDAGYIVGAGVEFDVKGGLFSIDGRYSESFGTITNDSDNLRHRVLSVVLAFAFR